MRTVRIVFTSFSAHPDLIKSWPQPSHWKFFPNCFSHSTTPIVTFKEFDIYMSILCLLGNFEIMKPILVFSGSNISSVYSAYFFSEGWWYQFYRKVSGGKGSWKIVCDLRCFISSFCFLPNFFVFCSWYMYQERIKKDKHLSWNCSKFQIIVVWLRNILL